MKRFSYLLESLRPWQWLKNLSLFTAIFFNGQLFNPNLFLITSEAVLAFCLLSSSNYLVNDVIDASSDRLHPFKKFRPVARKILPPKMALGYAIVLLIIGLSICLLIDLQLFLIAAFFVVLHYASYFRLRFVPIIDVLVIAIGYILRVWAGVTASGYHISVWLFLTVLSFSLLLAIGKRRSELSVIQAHKEVLDRTRDNKLFPYTEKLLDSYVAMFANTTFLSYAYYTFLANPRIEGFLFRGMVEPISYLSRKWMMLTVPFVLYGIMRYLQLLYFGEKGVLEKVVTKDKSLLITIALWVLSVFIVIYGIGG